MMVSKTQKELLRIPPTIPLNDNYNDGFDQNSLNSSKLLSNINPMVTMDSNSEPF
jgi:hypothetical protein